MRKVPPDKDQDLDAFCVPFGTHITATPTAYGLVAADATAFAALATDFATRLATATNPDTRTKAAVTAKSTSKKALVARLRTLIKIISAHPGVTDEMRVELGLNPRDVQPTPVPAPSTRPLLAVDPDGVLRLVDETMPDRRGKPAGVNGAIVFMKIDGAAPAGPDEAKFAVLSTRTRCEVPVGTGNNGKTLWVLAQWYNERGELGPVSAVASTTIAA